MQALIFVAFWHQAGNARPLLRMLLVEADEQIVLLRGPGLHLSFSLGSLPLGNLEAHDLTAVTLHFECHIWLHVPLQKKINSLWILLFVPIYIVNGIL